MKTTRKLFAASMALLIVFATNAETTQQKGRRITTEFDKANEGFKGESSTIEMILINAYGDRITRKLTNKIQEGRGTGDKSIVKFISPKDVRDTKLLTWSAKRGNDSQWLYLPKSKKIKRITSRGKSGAFMGSELSYEDMSAQEVDQYRYKWLKDAKYKGRDVTVIERYPVDKNSGYSKQITYTDKKWKQALKVDYFDRKGKLLKIATFSSFKKYGKFYRPNKLRMRNKQTKKESILKWRNRKLFVSHGNIFRSSRLKD